MKSFQMNIFSYNVLVLAMRMTIKELLMLFFKFIVIIIIHAIIVPTLLAKESL